MLSSTTKPALFTPIKIGRHLLQHRVVLAPMTRMRSNVNGVPGDNVVEYYKQRSTPGGLLITEATGISANAGGYTTTPGIYTRNQIEAWKNVTQAVREKGGIIFSQQWHLGRTSSYKYLPKDQPTVVSASDIAIRGTTPLGEPYETPRALTVNEIKSITQDFAQAAKNAIEAGFHGVEIHGANGYLLDQFINTSSNKRTDQYGGSIENRARFTLEVVDAVVKAIGENRTAIRLSPFSGLQDVEDETPVATWSYITRQLENQHPDLAYLHFTEASPKAPLTEEGDSPSLDPFRKLWSGTFISAGNYSDTTKLAYERAEKSPNNLVAVGRSFIANPDLVERFKNNWKLNAYNYATFYGPSTDGYIDYPTYDQTN